MIDDSSGSAGDRDGAAPTELTTDFTPGPGGVMTDEVGVITGELTLCTLVGPAGAAGQQPGSGVDLVLRLQYKNAAEWYTVAGGRGRLAGTRDVEAVHRLAVGLLSRGGPVPPESAGWTPETAGP